MFFLSFEGQQARDAEQSASCWQTSGPVLLDSEEDGSGILEECLARFLVCHQIAERARQAISGVGVTDMRRVDAVMYVP